MKSPLIFKFAKAAILLMVFEAGAVFLACAIVAYAYLFGEGTLQSRIEAILNQVFNQGFPIGVFESPMLIGTFLLAFVMVVISPVLCFLYWKLLMTMEGGSFASAATVKRLQLTGCLHFAIYGMGVVIGLAWDLYERAGGLALSTQISTPPSTTHFWDSFLPGLATEASLVLGFVFLLGARFVKDTLDARTSQNVVSGF